MEPVIKNMTSQNFNKNCSIFAFWAAITSKDNVGVNICMGFPMILGYINRSLTIV